MIWMILLIVGAILWVLARDTEPLYVPCAFVTIVSLILFVFCIGSGIFKYPTLAAEKACIEALEAEIETVRAAHYSQVGEGTLVGGSLDNVQQSKVLSGYIRHYAYKKANYNAKLVAGQIRRNTTMFRVLADGLFISEKINELEKL